ncbi:MAG TPA: multidrug efflux RND transporter permease subunit [Gemmatimonadales bacterium]
MPSFFIRRPIVAIVIAILIVLMGGFILQGLSIEQYPQLAPPTIRVATTYPGAAAEVVEQSVATPLEQQVNGVDNMIYMLSSNTSDGRMTLDVSFQVEMDADMANVLTQNRVSQAQGRLPQEVLRQGITVKKLNPSILMVLSLYSPGGTRDAQFLGNYAMINIRDALLRVPGVAQVDLFGGSEYGMRIWLRPDRLTALGLTPADVIAAVQEQNLQAPAGKVGAAPSPPGQEFTYTVRAPNRLSTPAEFEQIILRESSTGDVVRLRDVGRVELGTENYDAQGRMVVKNQETGEWVAGPSAGLAVYLLPGANQLQSAERMYRTLEELAGYFPADMAYDIVYDTTPAVEASIEEIVKTLVEAFILVSLVVFLFLQNVRATIIPLLTVPISLIGTFIFFPLLGFSINILTMFGLVLAIGIVVDDAIVVVEAVFHHMEHGLGPREATEKAMKEVSGPVVAIALIMSAVFVPVGLLGGLTGRLYQQFALTIAISVVISAFLALSLAPALTATLLKPPTPMRGPLGKFFAGFNRLFESLTGGYIRGTSPFVRRGILAVAAVVAATVLTGGLARLLPAGFVPDEDQGVFIVNAQLPPASSQERTNAVVRQVEGILQRTDGVSACTSVSGWGIVANNYSPEYATLFCRLVPWEERATDALHVQAIMQRLRVAFADVPSAIVMPFIPPTIPGFGAAAGFSMLLQDRSGTLDVTTLGANTQAFLQAARQRPELANLFSAFNPATPQIQVGLDREKARTLGVPISDVFAALQTSLGGAYVNDFNRFGRLYRVYAQAEPAFRQKPDDIGQFYVRSRTSEEMVPLSTMVTMTPTSGTELTTRFNLFRSVEITGVPGPGYTSGQAMSALEEVAREVLPAEMGVAWNGISFQEQTAPPSGPTFALAIVFVFLLLAALYESWKLPWAVLLETPLVAMGAFFGTWVAGYDNNVFVQVGLIMLVGLAAKNAILIVEYAKARHDAGVSIEDASLEAARLRFRPILMTAFAFIMGVLPLVLASGAGAAAQQRMGTAVFWGMLIATMFGVFLIPGLFAMVERTGKGKAATPVVEGGP